MNTQILTTGLALLIFTYTGQADPLDTWTLRQVGTEYSLRGIAFATNHFVAVGNSSAVLTSTDAVAWLPRSGGSRYLSLNGIAYGGGQFIAAGAWMDGWILSFVTSSNGLISGPTTTWPDAAYLYAVAYGEGQFVAVGELGTFVTSTNGINWAWPLCTLNCSTLDPSLRGTTYGNGQFVAVGDSGTIVTSADSTNWVQRQSGTTMGLNGITSGNGLFVALGGYKSETNYQLTASAILTSTNGVDWVLRHSGTSNVLSAVAYGSGVFVAVGAFGTLLTSTDGINWTARQSGTQNHLWGVCYGNGHFVAVGDNGTILESGSIISLALAPSVGTSGLTLSLTGPTGLAYTIEESTDLVSWRSLTNIISTQPTEVISDSLQALGGSAFYRAHSQ